MAGDLITLSKALEDLRSELATAQQEGDGKDIKFEIQEVSLDLQIVAGGEVSGEVNAGWGILTAKAGAKVSEVATHKLNLKLKVIGDRGNGTDPLKVSGEGNAPK